MPENTPDANQPSGFDLLSAAGIDPRNAPAPTSTPVPPPSKASQPVDYIAKTQAKWNKVLGGSKSGRRK